MFSSTPCLIKTIHFGGHFVFSLCKLQYTKIIKINCMKLEYVSSMILPEAFSQEGLAPTWTQLLGGPRSHKKLLPVQWNVLRSLRYWILQIINKVWSCTCMVKCLVTFISSFPWTNASDIWTSPSTLPLILCLTSRLLSEACLDKPNKLRKKPILVEWLVEGGHTGMRKKSFFLPQSGRPSE